MKLPKEIPKNSIKMSYRAGWFFALHRMKPQPAKENLILRLDGNDFNNLDEFFCTFGEEVNGIGGYFGRQLYALYDCFRGDFGVKTITEITWYNHERSKKPKIRL
jgi:RNAse (barnase) inhibitor barstar